MAPAEVGAVLAAAGAPPVAEFYEFFAGGGMARAGLGPGWTCSFANDFDTRKAATYRANWGDEGELRVGDVRGVEPAMLPGRADLAWASFPCQDLSLAGARAGLAGERSGSFHAFWDVVTGLAREGRAPRLVALENVCGAMTSSSGRDLEALCRSLSGGGYRWGALVVDAALFVPQSRPRLFIVGAHKTVGLHSSLVQEGPCDRFHPPALRRAIHALPEAARSRMVCWNLPAPPPRSACLADVLDAGRQGQAWRTQAETDRLLAMMPPAHRARVEALQQGGERAVGAAYRRTRHEAAGGKVQRVEVRFDGVAGCLRTPGGGSSRQTILVVEGRSVRSRLLTPREEARLMGLDDGYILPTPDTAARHLTGDGVVVPVVSHLARHLLEPLVAGRPQAVP